jgi:hypothetical protein
MRILIALAPLLTVAAADAPAPPPAGPACQNAAPQRTAGAPLRAHPLGREPAARAVLTVLRTADGCQRPVYANERRWGR